MVLPWSRLGRIRRRNAVRNLYGDVHDNVKEADPKDSRKKKEGPNTDNIVKKSYNIESGGNG